MDFPIAPLKKWFLEERRSFPWRKNPSPYAVWVSEVMLQQTQAKVVVPYFEAWMKRFPTLRDLAEAPFDEVIKLWEGLGYYSRARNLYEGAQTIVAEYQGVFPETEEKLATIKGIGPYTRGAILSFAFHKKAAACDGNVFRVLSRYFGIEAPIDEISTQKEIRKRVQTLLPDHEPWIISEALIECGATICTKDPLCRKCPLVNSCTAFHLGKTQTLPRKKKGKATTLLHRTVGVISFRGKVLVKKGKRGKVMGELYEFPYAETERFEEGRKLLEEAIGAPLIHIKALPCQEHTFTRFKAYLFPHHFETTTWEIKDHEWIDDPLALPFSSGHRRILHSWVKQ